MSLLISLFAALTVNAVTPKSECQWTLESMHPADVQNAISRTRLTPRHLDLTFDRLQQKLAIMDVFTSTDRFTAARIVDDLLRHLTGAIAQIVMANDPVAQDMANELAQKLSVRLNTPVDGNTVLAGLKHLASQFEREMTMAQFLGEGAPMPEDVLQDLAHDHRQKGLPPAGGGPMQLEMIKIALQYGRTRGDVELLEIGPASSASLQMLVYYTNKPIVGISPEARETFKPFRGEDRIEMISGRIPEARAMAALLDRAPFQLIVAQDVLSASSFEGDASPQQVVEALRSLMPVGGNLIMINNQGDAPYFTRDQAEAAGFEIVRWATARSIAPEWALLIPPGAEPKISGELSIYVLRNGELDKARVRQDIYTRR